VDVVANRDVGVWQQLDSTADLKMRRMLSKGKLQMVWWWLGFARFGLDAERESLRNQREERRGPGSAADLRW
jgi:hypothetical protein